MLNNAFRDVRAFHATFDQPAPDFPQPQSYTRAKQRGVWINEEVEELDTASLMSDPTERMIGQADAYLDIAYFAIGGLVELGIKPEELWNIVQRANMAKRHLVNGELVAVKNAVGKIIKPEGWVAPEPLLAAEIERQSALGRQ